MTPGWILFAHASSLALTNDSRSQAQTINLINAFLAGFPYVHKAPQFTAVMHAECSALEMSVIFVEVIFDKAMTIMRKDSVHETTVKYSPASDTYAP